MKLNKYYVDSKSFIDLMPRIRAYELDPSSIKKYRALGISYGVTRQGTMRTVDPKEGYKKYLSNYIIPTAKKLASVTEELLQII